MVFLLNGLNALQFEVSSSDSNLCRKLIATYSSFHSVTNLPFGIFCCSFEVLSLCIHCFTETIVNCDNRYAHLHDP